MVCVQACPQSRTPRSSSSEDPGRLLIGPLSHVIGMHLASLGSSRKVVFFIAKFTREDMLVLKDLLETGKVKPFVERTYPMLQVAEAMRYLGSGHVQGKLVVTIAK